jgi:hypothetical protein
MPSARSVGLAAMRMCPTEGSTAMAETSTVFPFQLLVPVRGYDEGCPLRTWNSWALPRDPEVQTGTALIASSFGEHVS